MCRTAIDRAAGIDIQRSGACPGVAKRQGRVKSQPRIIGEVDRLPTVKAGNLAGFDIVESQCINALAACQALGRADIGVCQIGENRSIVVGPRSIFP